MKWSLSDLLNWVTSEWSDPNWPYKLVFWVLIGGAAWLLLRTRGSPSGSR
jgi:hypothetical protein